ncbi:MAG: hypothetical protein OXB86_02540 [Bdellovibrionales bacterium]|nr:hypothetical protein [Bdellovibrionales bacterium]
MTKRFILFYFFFLIISPSVWSFSETELESLESSGTKRLSSSPWRTQIGFKLQRNTLLNSSYTDHTGQDHISAFSSDDQHSLLDPSSLYYGFSLNLSYSLAEIIQKIEKIKNKKYVFLKLLKNAELFLSSSFSTPVPGYRNHHKNYNALKYLHYALGDVSLGLITPIYSKDKFFSDISFFLIPFPLSGFSQEAGFQASFGGGINLLYFLKKETTWSFALSLSQRYSFREYEKETVDIGGMIVNTPFSAIQGGSFIYRQNHNKYIPSNVRISANYYFGVDFEKIRNHDLGLAISSSWKIRKRTYFNCSLSWKDRISVHSPSDPDIRLVNPVDWFSKNKTVFSIGGSYSF